MKKEIEVKYEKDDYASWLKISYDGWQWQTLRIDDPIETLMKIIEVSMKALSTELENI